MHTHIHTHTYLEDLMDMFNFMCGTAQIKLWQDPQYDHLLLPVGTGAFVLGICSFWHHFYQVKSTNPGAHPIVPMLCKAGRPRPAYCATRHGAWPHRPAASGPLPSSSACPTRCAAGGQARPCLALPCRWSSYYTISIHSIRILCLPQ